MAFPTWGLTQALLISVLFMLTKIFVASRNKSNDLIQQPCPVKYLKYSVFLVPYIILVLMPPIFFDTQDDPSFVCTYFGIIIGLGQGPLTVYYRMNNVTIGNNWEIVICEFAKFVVIQSLFNLFPQTNHTWYNEGWIESNTWQYYFVLFSIIALLWVSFVRLFVLIYSGLDPMAFYENYFGKTYPQTDDSHLTPRERYYNKSRISILRIGFIGDQQFQYVQTKDYFKSAGLYMTLMIIIGWCLTLNFSNDVLNDNPLRDRVGYNNICVGLDSFPAKPVCALIWMIASYYAIRYASLESDFANQVHMSDVAGEATWCDRVAQSLFHYSHQFYAICVCQFILCFVIDPFTSPVGHTIPFIIYLIGRWVAFFSNLLQASRIRDDITTSYWVYCTAFGLSSLLFASIMIVDLYVYHAENRSGFDPVLPWQFAAAGDWCWFALQAIESRFTPSHCSMMMSREFTSRPQLKGLVDFSLDDVTSILGSACAGGPEENTELTRLQHRHESPNYFVDVELTDVNSDRLRDAVKQARRAEPEPSLGDEFSEPI